MNMTLPTDIARCPGRIVTTLGGIGGFRVTSTMGHAECLRCRRREPGAPDRPAPHMNPPVFVGGRCPERIAP